MRPNVVSRDHSVGEFKALLSPGYGACIPRHRLCLPSPAFHQWEWQCFRNSNKTILLKAFSVRLWILQAVLHVLYCYISLSKPEMLWAQHWYETSLNNASVEWS